MWVSAADEHFKDTDASKGPKNYMMDGLWYCYLSTSFTWDQQGRNVTDRRSFSEKEIRQIVMGSQQTWHDLCCGQALQLSFRPETRGRIDLQPHFLQNQHAGVSLEEKIAYIWQMYYWSQSLVKTLWSRGQLYYLRQLLNALEHNYSQVEARGIWTKAHYRDQTTLPS